MKSIKKIKNIDFKLKKTLWNLLFSFNKSNFKWNWLDFLNHREYIFWDNLKNINWKIYSKTNKLYSKIFEEQMDLKVTFVLDLTSDLNFWSWKINKKNIFQEVFYFLSSICYKNSDNFSVFLFNWKNIEFLPYRKDFLNIIKTIDFIENKKYFLKNKENILENIFETLSKNQISNNLIFFISDKILEKENKNLKVLSLKNEFIFVNIFDVLENILPTIKQNFVFNSWEKTLELSFKNKNKIEKFNNLREKKLSNFKNLLTKNKIWYIYIDSSKNSFVEIFNYFNKK